MLDLLKLKTFLVVAETNSFTRAAAELGYCQSSITTHIQGLERELGAPLFYRVAREIILTDVGRRTLGYANRILALAEETKAAVSNHGEWSVPLAVGAPEAVVTYRLPEMFRHFQVLYPHVQLNLVPQENSRMQMEALLDGTLDLAFIVDESVQSDQLTAKCLGGSEDILMVKAPDYDFPMTGEIALADITAARVLLTDKNCVFRSLFDRALDAAGVSLDNIQEFSSVEAARQCAIAGMGLAILPKMAVASDLKDKRLVSLPWAGVGFPVYLQMVRHRRRRSEPALSALWRLAEHRFAKDVEPPGSNRERGKARQHG